MYFNKLEASLKKKIAPVYLLLGDEPLQQMEGGDMIRRAVQEHAEGKLKREAFYVDSKFKWDPIYRCVGNTSLFSDQRLVEITFSGEAKAAAKDFFTMYVENPPSNTVLVVHAPKLDKRLGWVKKLTAMAVSVQIYNKKPADLLTWLSERMQKEGLVADDGVVEFITQRVEGNLLAAAQELSKLSLLCEDGHVTLKQAECSVSLSSRYSVYDLSAAAISGDIGRALQVLHGLRMEQSPLPLIIWALANDLRKMAKLERRRMDGDSIDTILYQEWSSNKEAVRAALERKLMWRWESLLAWCSRVDKNIKGLSTTGEELWNELLILLLKIAKVPNLTEANYAQQKPIQHAITS